MNDFINEHTYKVLSKNEWRERVIKNFLSAHNLKIQDVELIEMPHFNSKEDYFYFVRHLGFFEKLYRRFKLKKIFSKL